MQIKYNSVRTEKEFLSGENTIYKTKPTIWTNKPNDKIIGPKVQYFNGTYIYTFIL